jgi:hypothetical protein
MTKGLLRTLGTWLACSWMAAHPVDAQSTLQRPDSLRVPAACAPDLVAERPGSGTEIGRSYRGGFGTLQITNASESDAIAVLIDANTRMARRAIYLRRGETAEMTSLPAGSYRLQFQVGDTWLQTGRFCRIAGTSQFDELLEFEDRNSVDAIGYSRYDVTLYPMVFFGNVDPDALPNEPLRVPQ